MVGILLHICCGICACGCIEKLKKDGFEVTGFFYNPNIYPFEEYQKREKGVKTVSQIMGFDLLEGYYNVDEWFRLTEMLKDEPEGGKRCEICFRLRLEKTHQQTEILNIPFFTTTLTVSPHKCSKLINKIGKEIGGGYFIEYDFKKNDGFKKAIISSKSYNLYQQNYCGCVYSMNYPETKLVFGDFKVDHRL